MLLEAERSDPYLRWQCFDYSNKVEQFSWGPPNRLVARNRGFFWIFAFYREIISRCSTSEVQSAHFNSFYRSIEGKDITYEITKALYLFDRDMSVGQPCMTIIAAKVCNFFGGKTHLSKEETDKTCYSVKKLYGWGFTGKKRLLVEELFKYLANDPVDFNRTSSGQLQQVLKKKAIPEKVLYKVLYNDEPGVMDSFILRAASLKRDFLPRAKLLTSETVKTIPKKEFVSFMKSFQRKIDLDERSHLKEGELLKIVHEFTIKACKVAASNVGRNRDECGDFPFNWFPLILFQNGYYAEALSYYNHQNIFDMNVIAEKMVALRLSNALPREKWCQFFLERSLFPTFSQNVLDRHRLFIIYHLQYMYENQVFHPDFESEMQAKAILLCCESLRGHREYNPELWQQRINRLPLSKDVKKDFCEKIESVSCREPLEETPPIALPPAIVQPAPATVRPDRMSTFSKELDEYFLKITRSPKFPDKKNLFGFLQLSKVHLLNVKRSDFNEELDKIFQCLLFLLDVKFYSVKTTEFLLDLENDFHGKVEQPGEPPILSLAVSINSRVSREIHRSLIIKLVELLPYRSLHEKDAFQLLTIGIDFPHIEEDKKKTWREWREKLLIANT